MEPQLFIVYRQPGKIPVSRKIVKCINGSYRVDRREKAASESGFDTHCTCEECRSFNLIVIRGGVA